MESTSTEAAPGPGPAGGRERGSSEQRTEALLEAIGDPVMRRILLATNERARTAHELLVEQGVSQSSLYRKLHELQELGLLGIERVAMTPEGKSVELFRSLVAEVRVEVSGHELKVRAIPRSLPEERLRTIFGAMRREARP